MTQMDRRNSQILITVIFVISLILPVAFADYEGGKISITERRYLTKFPVIFDDNNNISRSIKSDFESWLGDNLYLRLAMTKIKGLIDFRVFKVSPTNLVHVGEEGWFFYTNDKNIQIAQGTNTPSTELLEKIKTNQVAIQKALKARGIVYVLVLTPSKVSIYPEYIRGSQYETRETYIDIVANYLSTNTTIPVINLKPALLNAKKDSQVYLKTETHWNEVGAYIGYSTIIQSLSSLGINVTQPVQISTTEGLYSGEFSQMMGVPNLIPPEPMLRTVINAPKAVLLDVGPKVEALRSYAQSKSLLSDYLVSYRCSDCNKNLLLLGDSFFNTWNIPQLFAENFNALDYVPTDQVTLNLVDITMPDIVILERTERFLYTLANDPDPYLISEPLQNLEAAIRVINFQEVILRPNVQDLDIVVKNTGLSSWSEDQMVRLCIFQNFKDVGLRIRLPADTTVSPGEKVSFVIPALFFMQNAPSKITIKMVQEGYKYFGNEVEITISD